MSNTFYKKGQWNAHCDVCGFRYKADELRKRWDGLMVCKNDFEHDHPQKYIRVTERAPSVEWVRHQSDTSYVFVCTLAGSMGAADVGTADCARADYYNASQFYCDIENSRGIAGIGVAGCATPFFPTTL